MIIKGFTIEPPNPRACARLWRFYGTRRAVRDDAGRDVPHPNAWELVAEVKAEFEGGRYHLPDFELEATRPRGWRFYNPVMVDARGRETWHADNEIVCPPELAERFADGLDVATLLLYNLELKGHIAPGQLRDAA